MRLTMVIIGAAIAICCAALNRRRNRPPKRSHSRAAQSRRTLRLKLRRLASAGQDYASTRFSELVQINPDTVKQLCLR